MLFPEGTFGAHLEGTFRSPESFSGVALFRGLRGPNFPEGPERHFPELDSGIFHYRGHFPESGGLTFRFHNWKTHNWNKNHETTLEGVQHPRLPRDLRPASE